MGGKSLRSVVVLVLVALLAWQGVLRLPALHGLANATQTTGVPEQDGRGQEPAPGTDASDDGLPAEARDTLQLIARDGPFPYDRDGVVFGNYERQLPAQARGYYREYTVPTPGAHDRGARRIIAGGDPPQAYYYTGDHYRTFRRIGDRP